jgi:hypothetical protein
VDAIERIKKLQEQHREKTESKAKTGVKSYTSRKLMPLEDCKAMGASKTGRCSYSGYLNTKGVADSYGDIPYNLNGQPVYDLTRMMTNPVVLVDHENSTGMIAGRLTKIVEDQRGLYVEFELCNPDTEAKNPKVAHAVKMWEIGFARALSMGGEWRFEDPMNPAHLTKAIIHEGSIVAIGADMNALAAQKPA